MRQSTFLDKSTKAKSFVKTVPKIITMEEFLDRNVDRAPFEGEEKQSSVTARVSTVLSSMFYRNYRRQ